MFYGSIVALVTPMKPRGEIDEPGLGALIERQITAGTHGIVVNGTTGESATLNEIEREKIIKIAIEVSNNRVPIIAGTGAAATAEALHRTEVAKKLGVDACLLVVPYYVRPTQAGLYEHYRTIAEKVSIPLILYNVPRRTGCDLLPETVQRLSHLPTIVGLKEATGDINRLQTLKMLCEDRLDFYSGDDETALEFILKGGKGVISVTANLVPKDMADMCAAALKNQVELAQQINQKCQDLHKVLTVEPNPIPVKWAMQQLGWIKEGIRLPLTPLSESCHEVVRSAMKKVGLP